MKGDELVENKNQARLKASCLSGFCNGGGIIYTLRWIYSSHKYSHSASSPRDDIMDFLVVKRAVRACEGLVHWNPGQVLDGASLIWDSANLPAPPAPNPHFPTSHVGNHPQQKVPPKAISHAREGSK